MDEIADLTISVSINGNWWTLHLPFPIFENQRFVKDSIPLESEFWDSIPNYQIIIKLSIYPKLFKSSNRILLNVDFFFHPRFSIERSKSLNNFFVFFFFYRKKKVEAVRGILMQMHEHLGFSLRLNHAGNGR